MSVDTTLKTSWDLATDENFLFDLVTLMHGRIDDDDDDDDDEDPFSEDSKARIDEEVKDINNLIMRTMAGHYSIEIQSQKGHATTDEVFVDRATSGCTFAAYKRVMALVLRFARRSYVKRETCDACRYENYYMNLNDLINTIRNMQQDHVGCEPRPTVRQQDLQLQQ